MPPGRIRLEGRGREHHEQTKREGKQWADKSKKGTQTGREKTNRETKRQRRKEEKPEPRGRKVGRGRGEKTKSTGEGGKDNNIEKKWKRTGGHQGGRRKENTRYEGGTIE